MLKKQEKIQTNLEKALPPVMRIISILEIISCHERPLSFADISYYTAIPKSSVHRLCKTLVENDYLIQDPQSRGFYPARRLRDLSVGLLASSRLYIVRHEIMRDLAKKTGETCNLAIPHIDGMRYLDRVETNWPLRFQFPIGTSVPFHCTASGKLFLSRLSKLNFKHFLDNAVLTKEGPRSITDKEDFKRVIKQTRIQGYSEDNEEFVTGMIALSVPIYNTCHAFYASLSLQAPKQRLTIEQAKEFLPDIYKTAQRLQELFFTKGES